MICQNQLKVLSVGGWQAGWARLQGQKRSRSSYCASCWPALVFFDIVVNAYRHFISQVFRGAPTCQERLSSPTCQPPNPSPPPPPPAHLCLQACWYYWGYMLSVTTSPLPGSPQSHTCEYSRSPRAERHADVWLGTAGCPHQECLSQVGTAARQLQHRSPFTEAAELSAQTECCYSPLQVNNNFEIHAEGKTRSQRTRCPLLNMFKDLQSLGGNVSRAFLLAFSEVVASEHFSSLSLVNWNE